jgi:hypothetical protein
MNLKVLLEDLERLERGLDEETDIVDFRSDLRDCCQLLKDIMGVSDVDSKTKQAMKGFDALVTTLKGHK